MVSTKFALRSLNFAICLLVPLVATQVLVANHQTVTAAARAPSDTTVMQPGAFSALHPCRVLDSREGFDASVTIDSATSLTIDTSQVCGISTGAIALAIAVTVTNTLTSSWAQVAPNAAAANTSSVNWTKGQTVSSSAVVGVSSNGKLDVTVGSSLTDVDVIIDVTGQWLPTESGVAAGRMVSVQPYRVVDTRKRALKLGAGRSLVVSRESLKLPVSASAVIATVTVTNNSAPGFVAVFDADGDLPLVSNVTTDAPGQTRAAGVIVGVGVTGLTIFAGSAATDVVLDLTGYVTNELAPITTAGLFVPVTPRRVLDTRGWSEQTVFKANTTVVADSGFGDISAVVATLTATLHFAPGYAAVSAPGTFYETSTPAATATSIVNWPATSANEAFSALSVIDVTDGRLVSISASVKTALILDVTGFVLKGPSVMSLGVLSDTTMNVVQPSTFVNQVFSPAVIAAAGGVRLALSVRVDQDPMVCNLWCAAITPYVPSMFEECDLFQRCILFSPKFWNMQRNQLAADGARRSMTAHEFAHVLSMRYQQWLPPSAAQAWSSLRDTIGEECLADTTAEIALVGAGFWGRHGGPEHLYTTGYNCDDDTHGWWASTYGPERVSALREQTNRLAAALLLWAQTWGTQNTPT